MVGPVHLDAIKRAFGRACHDVVRHHTLQVSAALSYYFVLAVFPSLIVLSAVLGFIPLHLFIHVQYLMDRLLPADTMKIITPVLNDVLSSHHGTWLSFGMLGTIWVASASVTRFNVNDANRECCSGRDRVPEKIGYRCTVRNACCD